MKRSAIHWPVDIPIVYIHPLHFFSASSASSALSIDPDR
jgi:hypothetical protein